MSGKNSISDIFMQAFNQIQVRIDPEFGILWVYQNPRPRPCFNPALIAEVRSVQTLLETYDGHLPYQGRLVPIHYHVLDSLSPGIFSMGGDLDLFRDHVLRRDRDGLLRYAKTCIDTIHAFIVGFRLPITTISLVRGDALGGGFEVAMANQVVIAERQVEMGFPEILFNIFPGMGGYHLLCQRLAPAAVERMMLSGRKYGAAELEAIGVVDRIADTGAGDRALYAFVEENRRHRNGYLALQHVKRKVQPIAYEDLMEVCNYWVETTLRISERDLRLMERLVRAQDRRIGGVAAEDAA
ncbi:MAG: crotonase/enoyl-CoA hydratase family protein [Gammaproteobacteria bacterium]|nr:crotonase/enoyl-CoA hydratase family protein [Gammaproteobacteria bacterium]